MLFTADTLANYAAEISRLYDEAELILLKKITKQIIKGKDLSDSDWKLMQMKSLSKLQDDTIKELKKIEQFVGEKK